MKKSKLLKSGVFCSVFAICLLASSNSCFASTNLESSVNFDINQFYIALTEYAILIGLL